MEEDFQQYSWKENLINYYDALEWGIASIRKSYGLYDTHFGLMEDRDNDYCFCKSLFFSDLFPEYVKLVRRSVERMQCAIFQSIPCSSGANILDVGCGVGGTLYRLADRCPDMNFSGINLNKTQLVEAEEYLKQFPNVHLLFGDFNTFDFQETFDLIYFIESAFHNEDKSLLCDRIGRLLKPGGSVYIVDLFISDTLAPVLDRAEREASVFHFLSLSGWLGELDKHDIRLTGYEDISRPVANFLRYQTDEEEFITKLEKEKIHHAYLLHLFRSFRQIGRMLGKGSIGYGILRCKKNGKCDYA